MTKFYTKEQQDEIGAVIGSRIKAATSAASIVQTIESVADVNLVSDAQLDKLNNLVSSKFLGAFLQPEDIPTENAGPGSYAHVDSGVQEDVTLWIYDTDVSAFVLSSSNVASEETASTIKQKYESNANTNAFTDAEKQKLQELEPAENITDFTNALNSAAV